VNGLSSVECFGSALTASSDSGIHLASVLRDRNRKSPPPYIEVFPSHGSNFTSTHTSGQRKADYSRYVFIAALTGGLHKATERARTQAAGSHPRRR